MEFKFFNSPKFARCKKQYLAAIPCASKNVMSGAGRKEHVMRV